MNQFKEVKDKIQSIMICNYEILRLTQMKDGSFEIGIRSDQSLYGTDIKEFEKLGFKLKYIDPNYHTETHKPIINIALSYKPQ